MEQTKILNKLLASSQVIAANVKGRHWTVYGTHFVSLHVTVFDEVWKTMLDASDKVAETVRVLGGRPLIMMDEFIDEAFVATSSAYELDPEEMARMTRDELNLFIEFVHDAVEVKSVDPTTESALTAITDRIRHHVLFLDGFLTNWQTTA